MRSIRDRRVDPAEDPARWAQLLESANLPERYRGARAEAIRSPALRSWTVERLEGAEEWLAQGLSFYVDGPLNAGKSSYAALFLMEAVRRCERALWLPVRDVPYVRFREDEKARELDAKLRRCDLLVLDDLGAETFRLSGAAGGALEASARTVYDRGRSVVWTSNISWREFPGHYPAPFVSVVQRVTVPITLLELWPGSPSTDLGAPRG